SSAARNRAAATVRATLHWRKRRALRESQAEVASAVGERGARRHGLDLALQISDQLRVTLRFPVHRVLQPLDETLEVSHARLERLEPLGLRRGHAALGSLGSRTETTNLPDPG